jgi:hypothetical protein
VLHAFFWLIQALLWPYSGIPIFANIRSRPRFKDLNTSIRLAGGKSGYEENIELRILQKGEMTWQ